MGRDSEAWEESLSLGVREGGLGGQCGSLRVPVPFSDLTLPLSSSNSESSSVDSPDRRSLGSHISSQKARPKLSRAGPGPESRVLRVAWAPGQKAITTVPLTLKKSPPAHHARHEKGRNMHAQAQPESSALLSFKLTPSDKRFEHQEDGQ